LLCFYWLFASVITALPDLVGEYFLIAVIVTFGADAHEVLARVSREGYAIGVTLEETAVAAAYLLRLGFGLLLSLGHITSLV
jgi:hypothetical protein